MIYYAFNYLDNIGFTKDGALKLLDFGLCTCVKKGESPETTYQMTGNTGSLRYMAPEVALRRPYNEKVDVYSYGIVVWQMARDQVPYKHLNKADFMTKVALQGERPKPDKSWPSAFTNLLESCWHANPHRRPKFKDVVAALDVLMEPAPVIKIWPYVTGRSSSKNVTITDTSSQRKMTTQPSQGEADTKKATDDSKLEESKRGRNSQSSWF